VNKLKEIEELADVAGVGTVAVAAITPKVISRAIIEVARGSRVFAQFFRDNRDLMGQGTPHEIAFPRKGTGVTVAWDVGQGTSIGPSSFAYSATTIRVKKAGLRLQFNNEALEAAMRDVIADHIYEAGQIWAEQLDDVAKTVMLDLTTQDKAFTTSGTITLSTFPIISVDDTSHTISSVDYDTGTVILSGSVAAGTLNVVYAGGSIQSASGSHYVVAAAINTITAQNILNARAKIVGKNFHPDVAIMNDADIPGFLYDSNVKWLDAWAYRGKGPLLNAEVGQLFGLRVVTTTRAPAGVAIVLDSSKLGYNVMKRDLKGVREDKPEYDQVWYHYWSELNFGKTEPWAVALVVNGGQSLAV